jgi:hypothetical protein
MRAPALALGALALSASAALADPAGAWRLAGVDPDGAAYEGEVRVEAEDGAWRVFWRVGAVRFEGVGLFDGARFAVGFHGDYEGVALLSPTPDGGWTGPWTSTAGGGVGRETWTPLP